MGAEGISEEKMKKEQGERTKREWNVSARAFHPQEKKGEQKKHEQMDKGETIKLYPKGGVMVINETKLSDNKAERNIEKVQIQEKEKDVDQDRLEENMSEQKDKEEEIISRRREEDNRIIKKHEEEMARKQQRIQELEQETRRLKSAKEKRKKSIFFPHGSQRRG